MSDTTLWNRFVAATRGEVSADTLEAYRRASAGVYDARRLRVMEQFIFNVTCEGSTSGPRSSGRS